MASEPNNTIQFAGRMAQLPPYLFGMINQMKMEKRWQGDDVIDLGMGNPVDPAPAPVIEKLVEVANDPKTHRYPVAYGMRNLRIEIAKSYKKDYGVELDPDAEIICTIGSKEGISHLCLALIGPGDTVLVPAPAFPVHIYAAIIAGGSVLRIPLAEEPVFLERLETMCANVYPRPKVLILNYPHNPTAVLGTRSLYERVVYLAKKYNFMVIHDFAYNKITFDGYVAPSFLEVPGARDVGVEFGSFSKSYNMAGWRLGYCVGNKQMVTGLRQIKGYYDYGIFSAIQIAGIVALRHCDEDVLHQAQIYQNRRDVLCEVLERMDWPIERPKAGMFAWAKIPPPFDKLGSMEFSIEMMKRANVALAPGIGFGEEGEGYLRIALVENEHRIRQALRQMKKAMREMEQERDL
ncbi:aminotransferase class I/II-fold pyridoxal phosphate-dependent enzyme [Desulfatitalea alkaliphila]|uniref:Aminotransferase n=1 Tax=Desulfatitalea alkaliphila TaxID=2929485 RepID=A0AA41R1L7_9BACT|nr:aminotransferase class I/II-fold pyridoxal phosphate-dependent enzyme [Desulfatitalea alkaliphila]MCJ8499555.1 aminotransferase class I/II-fold pyridoxal phosphate-dependent enzyme [Desulfatitalea alkaliphila]